MSDSPMARIMGVVWSGRASVQEIEAALGEAKELGAPPSAIQSIESVLERTRAGQSGQNDIEKSGLELIGDGLRKQAEDRMNAAGDLVDAARKVALQGRSIRADIPQLSFNGRLASKKRLAELRDVIDGHKKEIFKNLQEVHGPEYQGFKDEVNSVLADVENIFEGKQA